ncbi:HD family phosphohydrolase [Endomicrobium proavitum]|uniref:7TM receptor with intracellular metal dependent phosphohydrolase n=1 Tax=Endomicrobium proavitum TaxID=1408281 RepID=A0A0G3WJF3_9BACT|nr:HDIG domain-containing metalloprotein [Endomicrobium proavitum]AKL97982.1 7TM receptor with intracellular metal dependent phosphohydrolase [Endomicrobium proavitum]
MDKQDNTSFFEKLKTAARRLALGFARKLGEEKEEAPATRNITSFLMTDIKIPIFLSVALTVIAVYFMLVMDLGADNEAFLSVAIFVVILALFFAALTREPEEKEIYCDNDAVSLMCVLVITGILTLQISKEYGSPLIFPVSAFIVMAAMLLSVRIAILYTFLFSVIAGLLVNKRLDIFFFIICSGLVVIPGISRIRKRSDFLTTGIKIVFANALTITMFYLLDEYTTAQYAQNLVNGVFGGALSVLVILVFMPLFEKLFSRTTNIKLIELSDFNNSLLKNLMLDAPGTYHHSLMTAVIAEQAADAIGANSILARVGAYYHDIGKLKNPEYFIENQAQGSNPHDPLTPAMSSLILISHVKDGVFLAKKNNIDKAILDSIQQHHGTTIIRSFYLKALEAGSEVSIENFKYPGPKPKTKVAAIIMIADSAEAACRALEDPTVVRIKETVEKIINNKFTEGQFDDCPITLKDLQTIRDSVTSTVTGIYHARIEYKENK